MAFWRTAMAGREDGAAVEAIRAAAVPLTGGAGDLDALLELIGDAPLVLLKARLERAIGVIYKPETERWSHYFHARLADQFDAVIHYDTTRALRPLEPTPQWESVEPPETYPSGI